ncbi:MAG: DUF1295 domain-containing protein [Planctomycetota bacterium]|nr:DUF1295 domain-containing protein [Planctomycetota bacterium]
MNTLIISAWIWLTMAILFWGAWWLQTKTKNAGIVDLFWVFGTGAAGLILVSHGSAPFFRRTIISGIICLWTIRLGAYLGKRIWTEAEDGRYADLRTQWADQFERRLFVFYQLQAFWTLLFAIPMFSAAMNPVNSVQWYDIAGIVIFLISILGEFVADAQLSQFRKKPENRGQVCRTGLWKYSRHPNYFFEWLHWFAYFLIGLGSPWALGSLAGVVVMYWFLTRITGIPITEKRILKTRRSQYEIYQREVSAFFPWPVKPDTNLNP